jgi:ATP-dependent DNA helicase 2 subunit 2
LKNKLATSAELVVICLDVGPSMGASRDGKPSHLENAVKAIDLIVQNKILHTKKDEVGLVLFGTRETDNDLAAPGQYQNISTVRQVMLPDLQLLRFIENSVVPSTHTACFVDALIVGMDLLVRAAETRKNPDLRLVMFTDAGSPFNDDQVDQVIGGLVSRGVTVQIVGIDFGDDGEQQPVGGLDGEPPVSGDTTSARSRQKHIEHSARQLEGIHLLQRIAREADGQLFSFDSAVKMVSQFRKHSVKQVSVYRGNLDIADLKIPVWGYSRQRRATAPSFKKLSGLVELDRASTSSGAVERRVTYHLQNDEETEIDKSNMAKGFKFGRDFVPWLQEDEDNMKLQTEKCLMVICFTESSKVPRHDYMGGSVVSFHPQPGDEAAATAVCSLAEALYEQDRVAVVRYVSRKNAAPKVGILMPHIKSEYVALLFVQIPFREDIRPYQFPNFMARGGGPTAEQLRAMDAFIDQMDLTQAMADDEGSTAEALQPKQTFNPVIQHIYQCLHHRAMNPDAPVPPLDEMIAKYVRTPETLASRAAAEAELLKQKFRLVAKTDTRRKGTAARLWQQTEASGEADEERKRARLAQGSNDLTMASMLGREVTAVGSVNPVDDYIAMVTRQTEDLLVEASNQLAQRIEALVDVYIGGPIGPFAAMVEVMRRHTVRDQPAHFNDFLQRLVTILRAQAALRQPFIDALVANNLTLISNVENSASPFTPADCALFVAAPAPPAPASVPAEENQELLEEL